MKYKVKIRPISTDVEITKGPFDSEEEAWAWTEQNNNPLVDYDVVTEDDPDEVPPWDE